MSPSRRRSAPEPDPVEVHVVYEVIDGPDAAALRRIQVAATRELLAWTAARAQAPADPQRLDEPAREDSHSDGACG